MIRVSYQKEQKAGFSHCKCCDKIFKSDCNLQVHLFPLSPFLTRSKS